MNEASRRAKLLIVNDNPDDLEAVIDMLGHDYSVIASKESDKGLVMARRVPRPDLIILSVNHHIDAGFNLCCALKAERDTATIPIIFLLDSSDPELQIRALQSGAIDSISKPYRPEIIQLKLANHITLRQRLLQQEAKVTHKQKELQLTQDITLKLIAELAEASSQGHNGHLLRVEAYMRLLLEELLRDPYYANQLNPTMVDQMIKSAALHDIGKAMISDAILHKQGVLSQDEFNEVKRHPEYGRYLLSHAVDALGENSFLRHAEELAYNHHERWDGSGYPAGLKGDEIPFSGRLMAIIDVYDALIAIRPYKRPFSHREAVMIIRSGSGTHFDPDLVQAFIAVSEEFRLAALNYADHDDEREALTRD
ncbi:MAG: HD domain-containing protein [Gammaproteobacteria bacterium]|nr:HD domain-containing protein [Gammaproteobacteria bacterium]